MEMDDKLLGGLLNSWFTTLLLSTFSLTKMFCKSRMDIAYPKSVIVSRIFSSVLELRRPFFEKGPNALLEIVTSIDGPSHALYLLVVIRLHG